MTEKVLLVDDDPNLLNALKRHFRRRFDLHTAVGGQEALDHIASLRRTGAGKGPAVVVVDMRMPGMDGVTLLRKIREVSPQTVRIMLTGNADQQTAVDAINEGNIFRFFCKPTPPDTLADGIDAGIRQYRLETAEQELLEKTLAGSVKVLVDVLSLIDSESFGRSEKIQDWAGAVARDLGLQQPWRLKVAAMLCQLGRVTVPPEIMRKVADGTALTASETDILNGSSEVAANLIAQIPRLEPVSEIIRFMGHGSAMSGAAPDGAAGTRPPVESEILRILVDVEARRRTGLSLRDAFEALARAGSGYDTRLLDRILHSLETNFPDDRESEAQIVDIPVSLLRVRDELVKDLTLDSGRLLLGKGSRLSLAHLEKIRNFATMHKFQEPVTVLRKH